MIFHLAGPYSDKRYPVDLFLAEILEYKAFCMYKDVFLNMHIAVNGSVQRYASGFPERNGE